jgi:predicted DsbA family dithiol-disulfide isomerase
MSNEPDTTSAGADGNATGEAVLVYADYVCPFCYLGYESFDRYREGRDGPPVETDWHPFDLRARQRRPDGTIDESVETGKDEAYYEQARQNVERLAEEYDAEMAEPLMKDVDSYDAQRVALRARETHPEAFGRFHRAVFDALWEDGRDIGDSEVLAEIAVDAGLPEGFVAETLADESSAERLEAAFEAAQEQRITGVPTFVAGEHTARGAVPPEHLRRLIEGT